MSKFYKQTLVAAFSLLAYFGSDAQCAKTVAITNTGNCLILSPNDPGSPPPFPTVISYLGETYNLTGSVNSNSSVLYAKVGKTAGDCFNSGVPSSSDLTGEVVMGSYDCEYFMGKLSILTVLPVNFSKFQAGNRGNTVLLQWANQAAANIIYFVIERSDEGLKFISLDTIRMNGSSIAEHSWIDKQPVAGKAFYRVKAMSKTGDLQVSSTLISVGIDGPLKLNLVPNPVKGERVNLIMKSFKQEESLLSMTDFSGRVILSRTVKLHEGNNSISLELPEKLAKGTYLVRASTATTSGTGYRNLLLVE